VVLVQLELKKDVIDGPTCDEYYRGNFVFSNSKCEILMYMEEKKGLVNRNFARGSVVVNSADGVKARCRSINSRVIDESVLDL